MDASNYSLADIRAATEGDRDDGFGGGAWWIIILFLFVFMGGGNLWGNRQSDYGQYAMAASQQEILYGQQFQGLNSALQRISDGTCNSTYALNNAITGEGRNVQMQLADCCCKTQTAIANLAAQTDRQTCAITTAIHAEGEQTRALMQADTIQQLRDKVSELQLGQSQCAQNAYLVNTLRPYPVPAYNPCGCQCGGNFGGAFAMS
nr:MAG TPA: hypothetical protein [Caudoviricetes sp.]